MRALIAALIGWAGVAHVAHAQPADRRYADEPTAGLALPTAPLAGEFDGRVVATNPGGLPVVRGGELALVLGIEDPDVATSAGQGFAAYAAMAGGGGLLPRFGLGLGLEWLRPSRARLAPDPGEPFRLTLGFGAAVGRGGGIGVAWRHFSADGALGGVDAFDLGVSQRIGNRLALGAVLRDVATAPVDDVPVQRRYELEAVVRPLATDRLELAAGGRLGETRLDVDGWGRATARIARGVSLHAQVESREVVALVDAIDGRRERSGRDLRATVGLELSFGGAGVTLLGSGLRDDTGANHALGGQLVLRLGAQGPASVLGHPAHLERIEIAGELSLREVTALVTQLRAIARDPSAVGAIVTFDGASAGWATLQELRDEVTALRRAGKPVFAYLVSGTGRDYFVASAATKIYMDPAGALRLTGIAGTTLYWRGLFDQVGIAPQFERIAEWKSSPEQYTERGPTPPAAAQANAMFDGLWQTWLTEVATSRGLTVPALRALIDQGPFSAGDLAVDRKLVDAVAPPDKVSELVLRELGRPIGLGGPARDRPERWQRPGIAVIYVDGDITDGKSRSVPLLGDKLAGGETLIAAIASARIDPRVGAIVLRIDSPGGSALASELVAREVFATRGVKPIVCSLSDVAASGGYFIAAGCELIFAEPMTITGSIGIFYGKFDISGLLTRLGVGTQVYARGARADLESLYRPYTAEERRVLQDKLRYMYTRFIGAVADGRGLTRDQVDAVARGRVWTGAQARGVRLVDRFGGLGDALDEAKRRMGLAPATRVAVIELPAPPAGLLGWIGTLLGGAQAEAAAPSAADLPVVRDLLRAVAPSILVDPHAAQARLPFALPTE